MNPGSPPPQVGPRPSVLLAPYTTLELGGPARYFTEIHDEQALPQILSWAASAGLPVEIIGGGSNLVVADKGYDGLVIRMATRGVEAEPEAADEQVLVTARAGEPWDALVEATVRRGWWGLECLSGIPGSVGATPIQNVGAYGREVGDVIHSVTVLERSDLTVHVVPRDACRFAYRHSRFKEEPGRFVVLAVTFALRPEGIPQVVRHPELAARVQADGEPTAGGQPDAGSHPDRVSTARAVREAVLALRRAKSMVLDPADPNRRSVGSFFLNPLVSPDEADEVAARARAAGLVVRSDEMPRFPTGPNRVKLSAAWLIERAGFNRGLRRGHVGISTNHVLALVHHGGGTTRELLAFADEIRTRVACVFGVGLALEPVTLGRRPADEGPRV